VVTPDGGGVIYTSNDSVGAASTVMHLDLDTLESTPLVPGSNAQLLDEHHLIWADGGALWAQRYDPRRVAVSGNAASVAEGVLMATSGAAVYAVSRTGTLAYAPGAAQGEDSMFWFGSEEALVRDRTVLVPTLSPDGGRVAYVVPTDDRADVWVRDLVGDEYRRVTFNEGTSTVASWSGDGEHIYFRHNDSPPDGQLFLPPGLEDPTEPLLRVPADGSTEPVVVPVASGYHAVAVAPDESYAVLQRLSDDTDWDLYVQSLPQDRPPVPLAVAPGIQWVAAVSPDSNWIAYSDLGDRPATIMVQRWPLRGSPLQVRSDIDLSHPRWSPDSQLYASSTAGVYHVPISIGTGEMRLGEPELVAARFGDLYGGRFYGGGFSRIYDVGPDGRVIVVSTGLQIEERYRGHLILIQGWADEVVRQVAAAQ
jgi:hypothetical protein